MTKSIKIIIIISLLLILNVGVFILFKNKINNNNNIAPNNTNILGGDRDEHGCIGSAGYSWCEIKNKCLRQWEEKCEPEKTADVKNCPSSCPSFMPPAPDWCADGEVLPPIKNDCDCYGPPICSKVAKEIKNQFIKKYPKYAQTISVDIKKETENYARGYIGFEIGSPGGIFLATKIDGQWQIIFDGNGQIPCSLSTYGFPNEMLADCS